MEVRTKKGNTSYRLTNPDNEPHLLTIQFYERTSILNTCLSLSVKFVEKMVAEVKDVDHDNVHRLGDANHDSEAQEFGVATVWFSAAKEDVLVSSARVRSFAPAYFRLLTRAHVFSSSFTQITYWALSSFATITYWASSSSFHYDHVPGLTVLL
jgi:hypothetical protein